MKKIVLRIFLVFISLIVIVVIGLLVNHAIFEYKYSQMDTRAENLSKTEIQQIKSVYDYLLTHGTDIYPGFDGKSIDLIIYNDAYEFLICDTTDAEEWVFIEYSDVLGKNIYRRAAVEPQAFAVYTADRWVGSMATQNSFNRSIFHTMTEQAGAFGYLIPPQVFNADPEYYTGLIVHEMLHAYQSQINEDRVKADETIHDVSSNYFENERFESLIQSEGAYLQKALDADSKEDILRYVSLFLDTRKSRRAECLLTSAEIRGEREFEWLEGMARYAEYQSSKESNSIIRSSLDNIAEKVKMQSDDRYYSLGLAEGLILDKLGVDWKSIAFSDDFVFEDALEQAVVDG
jgi:hypothetical protein